MKELACFDLDGTLLRKPSLFHRSLLVQPTHDREIDTGSLSNGVVDFVSQEVLEELAQTHGQDSHTYLRQGIRMLLRDNRRRRTHQDLIELSQRSDTWPQPNQFHQSVAAFAIALQHTNYHLHCETYSPQFLAEHLLCTEGVTIHSSHIQFDSTTGSIYETLSDGTLSGKALTQGDKAQSIQKRFGPEIRPAVALGDTAADISMLLMARNGVVVNASPEMRVFAIQEGMTLLDETEASVSLTKKGHTTTLSLDALGQMSAAEMIALLMN